MPRAALAIALLLSACSGSGSPPPPSENAAVSVDANSADMNSAEIVPDDEGGNEADSGA